MPINVSAIRDAFPALRREVNGRPAIYLDGPGGTQVHESVIRAMTNYMIRGGSNVGGAFETSQETDALMASAHLAAADFLGAGEQHEIVFGQNMTSLTYSLSRALSRGWEQGDEIVVSQIDHDANISPWLQAAKDRGVTIKWWDFDPTDCTLRYDLLPELLTDRTKLVAVTHASNAVGTITDVQKVRDMMSGSQAQLFVDAVHYAPHGPIDVTEYDCDFLACSAYKFFGPHSGILCGKKSIMESLDAYQVRPAAQKWETGTQSFESVAGILAAIEYIVSLSALDASASRRDHIRSAMREIMQYEQTLTRAFLDGVDAIEGVTVYGVTDRDRLDQRTPTFGVELRGKHARDLASRLGEQGVFVTDGNYYALAVMERLGFEGKGGLVRVGFVHYNTLDEVERLLELLRQEAIF